MQKAERRCWTFDIEVESTASPERLFGLLSDAPSWPAWFKPARRVDWVQQASDGQASGAGAVRRVHIGPIGVDEAILESQPPTHHAYQIRTTIPVRNHRADVWFRETSAGRTSILWSSSFTPTFPGTGPLLATVLRLGVQRLARALTAAAESAGGAGS
jgi:uncharacterized protein YndB with AHSA1/START domain